MDALTPALLIEIAKFLPLKYLPNLLQICKSFYNILRSDYLWRDACTLLFPTTPISSFYTYFISNIQPFLNLSSSFSKLQQVFSSSPHQILYKSLLQTSNPALSPIIPNYHCSPLSEATITSYSTFCEKYGELPTELYWLYLLYNGQSTSNYGVFGSYEFYDVNVSLKFLPVRGSKEIMALAASGTDQAQICIFVDLKNTIGRGAGAVYCNSGINRTALYLSPSIIAYIETYSQKLVNGQLRIHDENVSLYEINEYSSVNSKNGIKLTATAIYVPHLSSERRYLWSYQIKIEADNPSKRWKLTTRTWHITDRNGKLQIVDRQPGVIGLYPKVYTGSQPTLYSSCCYLETLGGEMSGFFSFINMDAHNETIDVPILPFRLELPIGSELVDLSTY